MKISKSILGVTGEYYVAAELGKRNIYAQLTLGNQKKADLLVFSEEGSKILKIEVKNKQGYEWPNCRGINQKDSFIVFVDFKDLSESQRPIFFILGEKDWSDLMILKKKEFLKKKPHKKILIEDNVLVFMDEINKQGQPYKGCGIKPSDIEQFKENWQIIINELS